MQEKKLEFWENLGTILWFALDACWLFEFEILLMILILPTIISNLMPLRYIERKEAYLLLIFAVNSWVLMNISWALGDLRKVEFLISAAKIYLSLGVLALLMAFLKSSWRKDALQKTLSYFRRFRISRH